MLTEKIFFICLFYVNVVSFFFFFFFYPSFFSLKFLFFFCQKKGYLFAIERSNAPYFDDDEMRIHRIFNFSLPPSTLPFPSCRNYFLIFFFFKFILQIRYRDDALIFNLAKILLHLERFLFDETPRLSIFFTSEGFGFFWRCCFSRDRLLFVFVVQSECRKFTRPLLALPAKRGKGSFFK